MNLAKLFEIFDSNEKFDYRVLSRNEVIKLFEEFEFKDNRLKEETTRFLKNTKKLKGYLLKEYDILLFSFFDKNKMVWHFLDLNNLDKDELTFSNKNSLRIFNFIIQRIKDQSHKSYIHLIPTPDYRRFNLYFKIIEKVIENHNLEYNQKITKKGIELHPNRISEFLEGLK